MSGPFDLKSWQPICPIYSIEMTEPSKISSRIIHEIPPARCTNSICFSPDSTIIYHADSPTNSIMSYPYDLYSGTVLGPGTKIITTLASPDGSITDSE
jgi:sugar lactone lactonase YvrE